MKVFAIYLGFGGGYGGAIWDHNEEFETEAEARAYADECNYELMESILWREIQDMEEVAHAEGYELTADHYFELFSEWDAAYVKEVDSMEYEEC